MRRLAGRGRPIAATALALLGAAAALGTPGAGALTKGQEIDASRCMWPKRTSQWDGRRQGSWGIEGFAYYGIQYLNTHTKGGHFRFRGRFPQARYFSLQSYDDLAYGISYVADSELRPDRGSVNPFHPGVPYPRSSRRASYTVDLLDILEPPPAGREPNVLYGGFRRDGSRAFRNIIEYRVYLSDPGVSHTGGVPLPRVLWVVDDPKRAQWSSAREVCAANANGPGMELTYQVDRAVQLSNPLLREVGQPPGPAANPPGWTSTNSDAVFPPLANQQSPYITTYLNQDFGEVVAIRFKPPAVPDTERGEEVGTGEEVRYWSLCTVQFSTTYADGCRHDTQYRRDRRGYVTVAVSDPEDRPVVRGRPYSDWLAYPGGVPLLMIRQLMPDPDYRLSPYWLEGRGTYGDEITRRQMGESYPRAVYCTRRAFERDRCGL